MLGDETRDMATAQRCGQLISFSVSIQLEAVFSNEKTNLNIKNNNNKFQLSHRIANNFDFIPDYATIHATPQ